MREFDVIKKPLITEKAMANQAERNEYAFVVNPKANKLDIKRAVQKLFNVTVCSVNTSIVRGKEKRVGRSLGRRSNWKKALVTLREGDKIELIEGV